MNGIVDNSTLIKTHYQARYFCLYTIRYDFAFSQKPQLK